MCLGQPLLQVHEKRPGPRAVTSSSTDAGVSFNVVSDAGTGVCPCVSTSVGTC